MFTANRSELTISRQARGQCRRTLEAHVVSVMLNRLVVEVLGTRRVVRYRKYRTDEVYDASEGDIGGARNSGIRRNIEQFAPAALGTRGPKESS